MSGLRILYHHRIRAEDGQAAHVRELIAALRQAGHEVQECALVPKSEQPRRSTGSSFWQGLRLPRIALESMELCYNRTGSRRLIAATRNFRPHFIYERHALHCRVGLTAARTCGVPLLLEVNSPMCEEMERLGQLVFRGPARRSEREVLSSADRVLPVSDVLCEKLIQAGARPEHCRVIRNGAVPERHDSLPADAGLRRRAELGIPEGALLIGFIGYMRAWHRLDLALQAIASEGLDDLHMLFLGEGPALPELLEQAARLGVSQRVHHRPPVPADELPSWVASFDLGLVAAINSYASPLKLFDYLAGGVPVLAPRQANIEELVQDAATALLFQPGDPASLKEKLMILHENREQLGLIGAAGKALLRSEGWTWAKNADRVIAAYEEVAG
ncbi:MAG: glycosyltransferase family 4 protein [Planctomycetota bacterium]|jgi:glycosyltransferase involved in cell wall biosynthesis